MKTLSRYGAFQFNRRKPVMVHEEWVGVPPKSCKLYAAWFHPAGPKYYLNRGGTGSMKAQRYYKLMHDEGAELTPEEIAMGWHFCPEWDSLLIGPGMGEMESCMCDEVPMKRALSKDQDGYFVLRTEWGEFSAHTLRMIANTLDFLNAGWTKEKAEELARREQEPIEGL